MTAGGTAGGVDGGAFDASVPDPGLDGGADSGIDAGAPDAGLAGGADAGAPDAAPRDAGLPLLDALATRAQRLCERLSECGLVAPADLATTCARPLRDAYWAFTVPQAWGHPMTDAGTRCAEIAALPCQTNLVFANLIDLINSCPMAFAPQAGLGSACVEDGDCSDPSSLC